MMGESGSSVVNHGSEHRHTEERQTAVIRFCGDSGDGMQTAGGYFTTVSAIVGNDVSTFPDYPAEIRAPAGTLAGVSGFQICFSSNDIYTPGDDVDTLIAMNPAALRANLKSLKQGGVVIVDSDYFDQAELEKAGYKSNPLEDGSLTGFEVHQVPITKLNRNALHGMEMSMKDIDRCRNSFALGLTYWLYQRPMEPTIRGFEEKFAKKNPLIVEANVKSLRAGFNYGDITEAFIVNYVVPKAKTGQPGKYRQITGNEATAYGMVTAATLAKKQLVYATYPITPASNILHELAKLKNFNVFTLQMEDEIAAAAAALGASYAGSLGVTGTSGPGALLKAECIALAVMTELPLVIVDVQRGGPSTGLPTKTEQADLLQAMFGRNSECPLAIVAPCSPSDCFTMIQEAFRIAVEFMTPVIFLSDGYVANGAEPWRIPDASALKPINVQYLTESNGNGQGVLPYKRDSRLVRPWIKPGTPGLEHRIGGIEKWDTTGNISYDPDNHQHMVNTRQAKIAGIADTLPPTEIFGDPSGELLVLGWGGTYGHLHMATDLARSKGQSVSAVHLRYLNPLPKDLGGILKRFKKVLIPELNLGQLRMLIRSEFLIDAIGLNKVAGQPFLVRELSAKIDELVGEK